LAPQGLWSVLGLEDSAGPAGKAHACLRSPRVDPPDVPRKSHLGHCRPGKPKDHSVLVQSKDIMVK
jgi:hypothetical protein